jgi:peroxiredoxin
VIAVRDHHDQLNGVLPIIVTFSDDVGRLAGYREHLAIPFPILANPDRSLYDAVGAVLLIDAAGRLRNVWLPQTPDSRPSIDDLVAATRAVKAS